MHFSVTGTDGGVEGKNTLPDLLVTNHLSCLLLRSNPMGIDACVLPLTQSRILCKDSFLESKLCVFFQDISRYPRFITSSATRSDLHQGQLGE